MKNSVCLARASFERLIAMAALDKMSMGINDLIQNECSAKTLSELNVRCILANEINCHF